MRDDRRQDERERRSDTQQRALENIKERTKPLYMGHQLYQLGLMVSHSISSISVTAILLFFFFTIMINSIILL